MSTLLSPPLCSQVTSEGCLDPRTGMPYADKTTRCSLLHSGTPAGVLCRQFLGSSESVRNMSASICAREPSLPECKFRCVSSGPGKCTPMMLILGCSLVAFVIFGYVFKK